MDKPGPSVVKEANGGRGRPFKKGQSGNPGGKRPGTRNAVTLAMETLLDGEYEALTRKLVEMAHEGNMAAMRLLMEPILRRERQLQFKLPPLKTAEDATTAISKVAEAVGRGELTESEIRTLIGIVQTFREAREHVELEARITKLEESKSALEEKVSDARDSSRPFMPLATFKRTAE